MDVPELLRLPFFRQGDDAVPEVVACERLARELGNLIPVLADRRAKEIAFVRFNAFAVGVERDLSLADGGVHLDVGDPRGGRDSGEIDIPAQAAAGDGSLAASGRIAVAEDRHDIAQRQGSHLDAKCMSSTRTAELGEVYVTRRKVRLARLLTVDVHGGAGIQAFQRQNDAAALPLLRHADLPLVPGRVETFQRCVLPSRMRIDRLALLLRVAGKSRPGTGHLEIAPTVGRHPLGLVVRRLPLPQTVDADALAGRRCFTVRHTQVPNRLHALRQGHGRRVRADSELGSPGYAQCDCRRQATDSHGEFLKVGGSADRAVGRRTCKPISPPKTGQANSLGTADLGYIIARLMIEIPGPHRCGPNLAGRGESFLGNRSVFAGRNGECDTNS